MPPVRRAKKVSRSRASSAKSERKPLEIPTDQNEETVRDFIWNVASIHTYLDDIHQIWANLLGVTEPQWLILMAIDELDSGNGVPGTQISAKVHIHPAFVTTQTQSLAKAGLVTRIPSTTDARFVMMSLTDKAREDIAKLSTQRRALNDFIFGGLDGEMLRGITDKLMVIKNNAEKAARRLALED